MTITRDEVLRRARNNWPKQGVPYDQGSLWSDGYRKDCAGYVCMALGLPASLGWGGLNTVTLVTGGHVRRITPDELKPGDLIGALGEGTAGDAGHVQIFVRWDNSVPDDNGHVVLEQTPDQGWYERHYAVWRGGYAAYRYVGIEDGGPAPAPAPAPQPAAPAWPLPRNEYFGNIAGPAASHGGYYQSERRYVRQIQAALNAKGYGAGDVDGIFGNRTEAAAARWQYANMPGTQYPGQVWWDDWAKLLA